MPIIQVAERAVLFYVLEIERHRTMTYKAIETAAVSKLFADK